MALRAENRAALAEQLRAGDIGLEFLTGELQGSHDPSGVVFTVLAALSGMEREYIRDRTLEGAERAQRRAGRCSCRSADGRPGHPICPVNLPSAQLTGIVPGQGLTRRATGDQGPQIN